MEKAEYVILGNGIAGTAAAEEIRRHTDRSILMITAQPYGAYLRPLLSKAKLDSVCEETVEMCDLQWYENRRIKLVKQCFVERIFPDSHEIITSKGKVHYKKCIYALGSSAFVPSVSGNRLKGVFSLRDLEDILEIKKYALRSKEAVVIGGGVIGMEISELLHSHGLNVTVLESQQYLMERVLDRQTAEEYQNRLGKYYKLMTDVTVERLEGKDKVSAVSLKDGRRIPCDMVIFSCGVRANTGPAKRSGLRVNRGVIVNRYMETDTPDIYACGDCAELEGTVSALWKPAMDQGMTAGASVCGYRTAYTPRAYPIICNSAYVPLFAVGEKGEDNKSNNVIERSRIDSKYLIMPRIQETYKRTTWREGKLVGAAIIGNLAEMESLKNIISGGE